MDKRAEIFLGHGQVASGTS